LRGDPATVLASPLQAVLNESTARKYFGDTDPIGKDLTIDFDNERVQLSVSGIMADWPDNSHLNTSILMSYESLPGLIGKERLEIWFNNYIYTYLMLAGGVAKSDVEAKLPGAVEKYMGDVGRAILGEDIDIHKVMRFELQPIADIHLHPLAQWEISAGGSRKTVVTFALVASLVLLIACINFINLSTARSARRAKEVGVRKTLGAGRREIMLQFLGETAIISLVALGLSLLLVQLALPYYNAFVGKNLVLGLFDGPDMPLILLGFVILVGLVAGSYPAFVLAAYRPAAVLRGNYDTSRPGRVSVLRKVLPVFQFTVSIVLVIGTLVVLNQLRFVKNTPLGFNTVNQVVVETADIAAKTDLETFRARLLENTNIESVSFANDLPGDDRFSDSMFLAYADGRDEMANLTYLTIDENYIPTLGIGLVAGRNFSRDFETDRDHAFMINERAVKFLGYENAEAAIGGDFAVPQDMDRANDVKGQIIGVVKDFNFKPLRMEIEPLMLEIDQDQFSRTVVRIKDNDVAGTLAFLEAIWLEIDPASPFDYFFMEDSFEHHYRAENRMMTIFIAASMLAILIAGLGLFGLAAFTVERQTKQIGIRKVLGATISNVVQLISREFLILVGLATIIAWPVAWYLMSRWLENFAYRIQLNIATFVLAGVLALIVAIVTVSTQAYRAATVDPVRALRYE
jgi:putative ABC transport system permease protein